MNENTPVQARADMYLPSWLLIFSGCLAIFSLILVAVFLIFNQAIWLLFAFIGIVLALGTAVLWCNQTIRVINDQEFVYTTFLGNKKQYRFQDITELKKNSDSMTLIVAGEKVHIEKIAIVSKRLSTLVNQALLSQTDDPPSPPQA